MNPVATSRSIEKDESGPENQKPKNKIVLEYFTGTLRGTGRSLEQGRNGQSAYRRLFSFTAVLGLVVFVSLTGTRHAGMRALPGAAQSDEETGLRLLTDKFFAAYVREDLDALMQMWSSKSPELLVTKKDLQQIFDTSAEIVAKNLRVRRAEIAEKKATLRVALELSSIDTTTGNPSAEYVKQNRTFDFVKEGGNWKVWRYVSSEAALAAALVAAKGEEERKRLLAAEAELVTPELVRALLLDGNRLNNQASHARAGDSYGLALRLAEQLHDLIGTANALRGIGNVHFLQGNYTEALKYYQKSLKIMKDVGNKIGFASALNNIGNVHALQGNYIQALEHYQRCLKIRKETGEEKWISATLANIGNVHTSQGNHTQALDHYQESLKIREEIGDMEGIASTLNNIGIVHRSQGEYTLALEAYQRSLRIKEERGEKRGIANTLNNIGFLLYSQGSHAQALERYQKCLTISAEVSDRTVMAAALNGIGNINRLQQNNTEALEYYHRSLNISQELGHKEAIADTLTNIGIVQRSQGNHTQARQNFADAIAAVEELRGRVAGDEQQQQQFFANKLSPYHQMIELLIDEKKPGEGLGYVERFKGRALLDTLENGHIDLTKAMTENERAYERRLKVEVVSLSNRISRENLREQPAKSVLIDLEARRGKARASYEAFQINLFAAHPELKIQRGKMQPISMKQAGSLIKDGAAVLEFVVTEDRTYLFTITQPRLRPAASQPPVLKVYTLNIKQKELAERVEQFRRGLVDRDLSVGNEARELYDLLIGPARDEIANKTNLIIVPDGPLWELPFQALQSAPKRFLIEEYAISYAPSLTTLFYMTSSGASRRKAPRTLLALGNPAVTQDTAETIQSLFMDENLGPLPEAERLAKTLGQMYGPAHSKVYVGTEAQESRVKAEAANYRIIHIAAHGILNDKSPMYSQLVLSQAERNSGEDGLLEAWEIMNLDLKADLVILSACETARGRIGNGEGVIGLSWASFIAGAPATIVSQWKVETSSTTELMIEFHRNLRLRKSKSEALRLAALKLLKTEQYRHPFYWAGFVLIGNAR